MSDYLDTSVLVSLTIEDANSAAGLIYLESAAELLTSDWATAEFSSALGIQQRTGRIDLVAKARGEARLDGWLSETIASVPLAPDDAVATRAVLRSITTPLRAPDALHLVICRRLGATLVSFDVRMRDAARELNLPVRDL